MLDTVDFCLRKSRPLTENVSGIENDKPLKHSVDTGYCISFCFICGYGSCTVFGKDKKIFYE